MAIIQNDGKRSLRRPSMKGRLMLDVVEGQERARSWPSSRGKNLHPVVKEQMEWFRQAQWATKYMAPEMYMAAVEATKRGPILPRDVLTMMMSGRMLAFTGPDGRTIWSTAVATDVSVSLDVLSDVVGAMLVRTPEGWRGILPTIPGQVLTCNGPDEVPSWQAAGGGGGGAGAMAEFAYVPPPVSTFTDVITYGSPTLTLRDVEGKGTSVSLVKTSARPQVMLLFDRPSYPFCLSARMTGQEETESTEFGFGLVMFNDANDRELRLYAYRDGRCYCQRWEAGSYVSTVGQSTLMQARWGAQYFAFGVNNVEDIFVHISNDGVHWPVIAETTNANWLGGISHVGALVFGDRSGDARYFSLIEAMRLETGNWVPGDL